MVPLSSYQIPRVRQYSGSHLASLTSTHRTVTFFGVASQPSLTCLTSRLYGPKPQKYYYFWFGLLLFRSPLLKESIFLSLPVGTKMFQFPTFPLNALLYSCIDNCFILCNCVPTFGHLWFSGYLLLPTAFRSLSRPSSALGAKSFTLCS